MSPSKKAAAKPAAAEDVLLDFGDENMDGEVTFTRPGVDDAHTVTVDGGQVTVSADDADWYEQHAGAVRAAD